MTYSSEAHQDRGKVQLIATKMMITNKKTAKATRTQLLSEGYDSDIVEEVIENIKSVISSENMRKLKKEMLYGGAILLSMVVLKLMGFKISFTDFTLLTSMIGLRAGYWFLKDQGFNLF
ncbi:hypothetical protein [Flammeovirga aprica]|uniref:Uncharacterized protein n=1 Tax=Flammeovirga aprica JL-4 TaxID=694437 RepID=A0A7X9S031_9BACT|nr:hypothetical protein [Flammeovirga aprica]NME71871.1 hypothetical protein [Flammeovirga aprica JL-4]